MLSTCYSTEAEHVSSVLYFVNVGAFLVPYLVFVVTCGVPLFLLEVAIGQYTQEGGVTCWRKLCPIAEGILLSMFLYYSKTKSFSNLMYEPQKVGKTGFTDCYEYS